MAREITGRFFLVRLCALVVVAGISDVRAFEPTGTVRGIATDPSNGELPGVVITAVTGGVVRRTVSDESGNFALGDLPPGTYEVRAELAGFEIIEARAVLVRAGENTFVPFTLTPGCIECSLHVDFGFDRAVQDAALIAHVRIERSDPPGRCTVTRACTCREHVATVTRLLKGDGGVREGDQIVLVQENGDAIVPDGGVSSQSGRELIMFLYGTSSPDHFVGVMGSRYSFPIRDGRVAFSRADVPTMSDGMDVEQFEAVLADRVSRAR